MSWKASAAVKALRTGANGEPITAREKLLLFVLADNHNEEYGCSWAGLTSMANDALSSKRHVQTLLAELVRKGLLEIENRGHQTNVYRLKFLGDSYRDEPSSIPTKSREGSRSGMAVPQPPSSSPIAAIAATKPPVTSSQPAVEPQNQGEEEILEDDDIAETEHCGIRLRPEQQLIAWMRDAGRDAGKHWQYSGRANRGPNWTMKRDLREKEKTYKTLIRIWWVDYLLSGKGDEEHYPYSDFMGAYLQERVEEAVLEGDKALREEERLPETDFERSLS